MFDLGSLVAVGFEDCGGGHGDEGVAGDLLASHHALEQHRMVRRAGDAIKRGDRRKVVAEQGPINRNRVPLPGQAGELVKARVILSHRGSVRSRYRLLVRRGQLCDA